MKKIILLLAIVLGATSCDSYLDINSNPNSPSSDNVSAEMIFPGVEMKLAASYGDYLRIVGGYYAQQYGQTFGTSNYLDYSKFTMSAVRSSGTYTQLFFALKNLETIREKSKADEAWGTYLAATSLRVFIYQTLVDAYGEVPYSEGLDLNNLTPKYDDGLTVYNGILAELDDALSKATSGDVVPKNFLFRSLTAGDWIKFSNALKLKLLMRMSDVKNVQAELAALVTENNFPASDVAYSTCWADEAGKASPFYQEEYATYFGSTQINVVANIAYMETMLSTSDPRVPAFFNKSENGEYKGSVSGTNFSTSTVYTSKYFCRPVFKYNMPVYLITVSEIEFFLAEYNARYGTAVAAASHYKSAIEASFVSAGLTAADASTTLTAYPWVNADYKELIGIQKWIALGGTNNFEAWCEMRRLKVPAFGTVKGEELYDEVTATYTPTLYVPGTLYTPIKVNTELGADKVLQRFKYAEVSSNRNGNAPDNKGDATPVFWAE